MRSFLFVLLVAVPCFSQTTWGGLRFGMRPADARLALKDRPNKNRTEPASADPRTPETFFIDVVDVKVGEYQGVAHLRFDSVMKLDQVSIVFENFENKEGGCFAGISTVEAATRSRMVVDISEKMIERFGKPVSETGAFPTRQELSAYYAQGTVTGFAKIIDGKRIWRTEEQVIEEWLWLPCGNVVLHITYKPQTKDEL